MLIHDFTTSHADFNRDRDDIVTEDIMCGKQSPDYINILIFFLQLIFMSGGANPECMPHDTDIEQENSPESESTYECLQCGEIATAKTHPSTCDCGGDFQNRAKSLE